MGADLLITYVAFDTDEDTDARCNAEKQKIKDADLKAMKPNVDEFLDAIGGETTEDYEDADGDWEYGVREMMIGVIEDLYTTIEQEPRDLAWIVRPTETIYLSGGMSWGDSPGDSYDAIERYAYLKELILDV